MPHYVQLTLKYRYANSLLLDAKMALKEISKLSEIEYSTLPREVKRNSYCWKYDYRKSDKYAITRRKVAKKPVVLSESIKVKIIEQLKKSWSPEQISGRGQLSPFFLSYFIISRARFHENLLSSRWWTFVLLPQLC